MAPSARPPRPEDGVRLNRLPRDLQVAGALAAGLVLSVVLPWYEKSAVAGNPPVAVQDTLSALQVFSFVEAAVWLVAIAVLVLVVQRARGKAFHLPGGDGTVVFAAGVWTCVLLAWRFFDKPDATGNAATVGITWGILAALALGVGLALTGARIRQANRPEPPLPGEDVGWQGRPIGRSRRGSVGPRTEGTRPYGAPATPATRHRDHPPTDATRVLGEPPPRWEDGPPRPLPHEPPTERSDWPPR